MVSLEMEEDQQGSCQGLRADEFAQRFIRSISFPTHDPWKVLVVEHKSRQAHSK